MRQGQKTSAEQVVLKLRRIEVQEVPARSCHPSLPSVCLPPAHFSHTLGPATPPFSPLLHRALPRGHVPLRRRPVWRGLLQEALPKLVLWPRAVPG